MSKLAVSLLSGTALALLSIGAPATAQTTPEAQANAADTGDIVVTARRVEERLQDVPISITVFNQEQLSNRNVVTAADLGAYTPSLSVNGRYGPEKSSFAIRGFVQETNTSSSVGVYFADVIGPRAAGGTTSGNGVGAGAFFDLQNVQVLKGPQGTLFGRNTTGGAVLLVPRKPTDRFEGYVEGSAGDYDMRRVQAVVNIPVADTFRVRFGVDRNLREGYLRNHSGIGPERQGDVDYWAFRLSVVGDLTPNLENYLIASYSDSDTSGYVGKIVQCDTAATGTSARTAQARMACAQIARQNARGDGPWDVESSHPDPRLHLRQWQVINTTTWQASDDLTVKNIASYSEFKELAAFSLNGDNFVIPAGFPGAGSRFQSIHIWPQNGQDNAAQSTFTEELQFQGRTGALTWQAGAYLEISDPLRDSAGFSEVSLSCASVPDLQCTSPFGTSGSISSTRTRTSFNNKGLYAQGTYELSSQLSATAGIRYTFDKQQVISQSTRVRFPAPNTPQLICTDVVRFNNGAGVPLVVTDSRQCLNSFEVKSQRPTWLASLEYKPMEDMLLYGKYSRGYRQGGIAPANVGLETWGPEKVDAYEVGLKASFRGGVRGYFNIAGFYNDFSDQQLVAGLIPKQGTGLAGGNAILNAGKSTIWGVEVDAAATFFDSLRFELGYTYLNTNLNSRVAVTLPPSSPYADVRPGSDIGQPLPLSPKHRVSLTGTYTLPLDESIGRVSLGATYVYTAEQVASLASPLGILPSTNLLNLNVNWDSVMDAPVDLSFFMTNVTNEASWVNVSSGLTTSGFETIVPNQPRMWGVRARYRFGA